MVKDSTQEKESSLKKRRKTSTATTQSKAAEGDVYENVIHYEEAEAEFRKASDDKSVFQKTCNDIRRHIETIAQLKGKNTQDSLAEIKEKRIQVSLLFVILKKLNRLEKFRTKSSRVLTSRVKQQVDSYHLQLQNLLYEIDHLKKEVTKCLQFKSKDEEIDLVPVEEFYKEAPSSLTRPDITHSDPHQLKLARLEWELEQRKQLAELCNKLQAEKELVARESQAKRERLDNLAPKLKDILEVTKPLQDILGLPLDKVRKQHQVAYLLPKPLYVLYVQVDAYRQACDPLMTVSINGDEEEAKSLRQMYNDEKVVEESDSEQEDNSEVTNRHHRKLSRTDRLEEKKKKLLMQHPLYVSVVIKLKDSNCIHLSFYYNINLHVVTVKPRVSLAQSFEGVSAHDLIGPHNILTSLFPHDLGQDSPNVANHYQLQHLGLDSFSSYIRELGIPYIWAQRIAGLDFVGSHSTEIMKGKGAFIEPKVSVSQASVESVMKALRHRLSSRVALCKQVQTLESGSVTLPHARRSCFPAKLSSSLASWELITWNDYEQFPYTQNLITEEAVSSADTFYKALVTRGSAKLVALVAVKCDYPQLPSVFCLHLNWHGEHHAGNSDAVRDMEREMNVYSLELIEAYGRGWGTNLLIVQMIKLMSCLDIYLEAGGGTGIAPTEFPRDKVFFRPFRGRNRSRPYKYLHIGGGLFTQR